MTDETPNTAASAVPERFRSTSAPGFPASSVPHPTKDAEEFAPGHFWKITETPYELTVTCQCKWGWRWNAPWGSRGLALASYYDHARNETGWTPTKRGTPTWQGSSM